MEDHSKQWLIAIAEAISYKVILVALASFGLGVLLVTLSFHEADTSIFHYVLREIGKAVFITAIITGALKWYMARQIWHIENKKDNLIRHDLSETLEQLQAKVLGQTREVAASVKSLDEMQSAAVSRFYRNRSEASEDIKRTLENPEVNQVRVIGISLNDFVRDEKAALHDAWRAIEKRIKDSHSNESEERLDIRVLLIDPHCTGAYLRASAEESSDVRSRLVPDVIMAMEQFRDLMKEVGGQNNGAGHPPVRFEAKLYRIAPITYLVWTPDIAFVQPYYFRPSHRANVNIPVLKCHSQSADTTEEQTLHEEMKFHFDWIWSHAAIGIDEYLIESSLGTDQALRQANVENIFYDTEKSEKRILSIIRGARSILWIKGVSLRSFFQFGEIFEAIRNACTRQGLDVRVMFIDPEGEQAKFRSFREHLILNANATLEDFDDDLRRSQPLFVHTNQSIKNVAYLQNDLKLRKAEGSFNAKVFSSAPEAFVLLTESTALIEQYHYGKLRPKETPEDEAAWRTMILGADIPVVEYKAIDVLPTDMQLRDPYRIIKDHMEFVYQFCCRPLPSENTGNKASAENSPEAAELGALESRGKPSRL